MSRAKTLSGEARNVLSRVTIDTYRQPYPLVYLDAVDGSMPRPLYREVNAALEALGGKWSRTARAHEFSSGQYDQSTLLARIADVVDTGEFERPDDMGFFPTPPAIVDLLLRMAVPVAQGHWVLEPSAGTGAIADKVRQWVPSDRIVLVEIDEQRALSLRQRGYDVIHDDFMNVRLDASHFPAFRFDRVIMNPPFARGQSIDHVLHAFDFLKVGGVLVAVMPISVTFRMDRKHSEFRDFVRTYGEFEPLPADAFKPSGTMVKTVAVVVQK